MPLPRVSEQAARTIAVELNRLDRAIAAHIINGSRLPTVTQVMAPVTQAVTRSVTAALDDVGVTLTTRTVNAAVNDVESPVREMVVAALAQARRVRRRVPRRVPAVEPDTDGTIEGLVKATSAATALVLLVRRRPARERTPQLMRDVARQVGIKPPAPTSAYSRMVVATRTAIVRNKAGADIVDQANDGLPGTDSRAGWALKITDARNGDTDEPCERVNGKLATTAWLRNGNEVEHPHCTRLARPYKLRPGDRVTLLR